MQAELNELFDDVHLIDNLNQYYNTYWALLDSTNKLTIFQEFKLIKEIKLRVHAIKELIFFQNTYMAIILNKGICIINILTSQKNATHLYWLPSIIIC